MKRQALFLGIFTTAMFALPAFAADGASGMMELRWGKNAFNFERSEERRVGKECSLTCRSRWSPYH